MSASKRSPHQAKPHGNLPRAKKSLGQNFLIDESVLDQIVDSCRLTSEDTILEIGPGTGVLTKRLAARAGKVVAVEIDEDMKPILCSNLAHCGNITIYFDDILKVDLQTLRETYSGGDAFTVCANLPYYISTPVIMKLLRDRIPPKSCTVMVQKELGLRMAARPGGRDYGELSVVVQYYATPEAVCLVPPSSFRPAPKVDSIVLRLVPLEQPPVSVRDEDFFFTLVTAAFAHRRKTLVNSASASGHPRMDKEKVQCALNVLHKTYPQIDETVRAEKLSLEEFAALSDLL